VEEIAKKYGLNNINLNKPFKKLSVERQNSIQEAIYFSQRMLRAKSKKKNDNSISLQFDEKTGDFKC